jgi:hypothetical protein
MEENYILIGVVVFVLIIYLYNYLLMLQPCKKKVTYFANVFDIVPQLKVVEEKTLQESMDNGSHIQFIKGGTKNVSTNLMSSRWSGSGNSQPIRDSIGRTNHLDSIQANPSDFNPSVRHKEKFSKYVQHETKMNKTKRSAKLQGSPDDEWRSHGSVYDDRNNKALSLHMPSLYDSKFNTPN